jgi:HD superfamily phosphohydrolase
MFLLPLFLFLPSIFSLSTLFGEIDVDQSIINDAILTSSFQRLKFIDQGGPLAYFNLSNPFSRYEHSIGVWALIKIFNGTQEEQLAGLWHDISHTTFSHLADSVFDGLSATEFSILRIKFF